MTLEPGQAADVSQAKARVEGVPFAVVIGDKGSDSKEVHLAHAELSLVPGSEDKVVDLCTQAL